MCELEKTKTSLLYVCIYELAIDSWTDFLHCNMAILGIKVSHSADTYQSIFYYCKIHIYVQRNITIE